MKKKLMLLVPFMLLMSYCQSQQWNYNEDLQTVTYNYQVIPNGGDTILKTSLLFGSMANDLIVNIGNLEFKQNNIRNLDSLAKILTTQYAYLKTTYGKAVLQEYSFMLERMLVLQSETLTQNSQRSLVFQVLCFYHSLLNASLRDDNTPMTFTPIESFINGTTSFSCEEEQYINIPAFKAYLTALQPQQPNNVGIGYFLNALKYEQSPVLSILQINKVLIKYFSIAGCGGGSCWPQGSDCGCCGNYQGPCYFWHPICLLHDYMCQNCKPRWFCFSGCIPSDCSGAAISWFSF
jgi:hypothetical protein